MVSKKKLQAQQARINALRLMLPIDMSKMSTGNLKNVPVDNAERGSRNDVYYIYRNFRVISNKALAPGDPNYVEGFRALVTNSIDVINKVVHTNGGKATLQQVTGRYSCCFGVGFKHYFFRGTNLGKKMQFTRFLEFFFVCDAAKKIVCSRKPGIGYKDFVKAMEEKKKEHEKNNPEQQTTATDGNNIKQFNKRKWDSSSHGDATRHQWQQLRTTRKYQKTNSNSYRNNYNNNNNNIGFNNNHFSTRKPSSLHPSTRYTMMPTRRNIISYDDVDEM